MENNNIKNFFNNRKNILIFIGITLVILLVIIILVLNKKSVSLNQTRTDDAIKFEKEYENLNDQTTEDSKKYPKVQLPDSNLIKYANIDDIMNIFNNEEDAVIYFGYSTCLYCRTAVQVLLDTAVQTDLDEIYYINIEEAWDVKTLNENNEIITTKEADDRYSELLDALGDELVEDYILTDSNNNEVNTNTKRVYVPLVIFVVDGKVVSYNKGTLFSQEDPFTTLDQSQIDGLSGIYKSGIRDVLESKSIKNSIQ